MFITKILSLIISFIYLLIAYISGRGELLFKTFGIILLPLACIWFGDEIGAYMGWVGGESITKITARSPGSLIRLMGWFLLVGLPLIIGIIILIGTK
jgi:hypothetical protein